MISAQFINFFPPGSLVISQNKGFCMRCVIRPSLVCITCDLQPNRDYVTKSSMELGVTEKTNKSGILLH